MSESSEYNESDTDEMEDWRKITETTDEQYQYMQEHEILTDCTFVVGPKDDETREFKAHRLHVSRVSPVFEAMLLRGEMVEAKTGHVRITDVSPSTFHLLLNSIYGKDLEMTSYHEAQKLALAAHKYQMTALVEKFVTRMGSLIKPENVWTALETANLLQYSSLEEICVQVLQRGTLRCITEPGFMQASEENVALLLEQDELNVDDEQLLVNTIVHWARYAARQRGLSGDDRGVRAMLEPRLLKLFRFLAMSHQQFMLGPGLASWLTDDEKSAISECLKSGDFGKLPQHLSSNNEKRKNVTFMTNAVQIQDIEPSDMFVCLREKINSRPNVQQTEKTCCVHQYFRHSTSYYNCIHANLIFKVNSSCNWLGFQCASRCRDPSLDFTAFPDKKPVYMENIVAIAHKFNHTLSTEFQKNVIYGTSYKKETECNSTISIMFEKPVSLVPNNWFALEIKVLSEFHRDSDKSAREYPNPSRAQKVCTATGVQFVFQAEEREGYYKAENDGIFESLIFSL